VIRRVNNGNNDANLQGLHMLFKLENTQHSMQHLMNNGTQPASVFPFTLDTMRRPATIAFRSGEKAIFKIEGDHMWLNISIQNQNFPADFVSTPGSNATFLELKRVPK
jgi:hypothetical protein